MREELTTPLAANGPSYRIPRRSSGMDPNTRRLAIVAGGIGGALLLLVAGWSVTGHHRTGIPVIEAAAGPVRVKPENPGGMEVFVGEDGDAKDGKEAMAPGAEAPNPQALRAQELQPPAVPPAPVAAPALVAAPEAPAQRVAMSATQPAPASGPQAPVAAIPEPSSAPPARAAAPTARTAAPAAPAAAAAAPVSAAAAGAAGGSGAQVQLAALNTEQAALAEWERLARKMPDLLSGRRPAVTRTEREGRTYFRLRTGGFADVAQATTFCQRLREKGAGCSLASF